MNRTAVDTNVVVAGLLSWHEHHERAFRLLDSARSSDSGLILPSPVLIEAYSVMTRLPPPFRISPRDAHTLLRQAFTDRTNIAAVPSARTWEFFDGLAPAGVSGGMTYDAHIVACARSGGALRLATFNLKHFERLDLGELELISP